MSTPTTTGFALPPSPIGSVFSPSHGQEVRFGRVRPPRPASDHLRFRNYLTGAPLPTPPAIEDWSKPSLSALKNIYLNDRYGICTVSGAWHVLATWTGNAGQLVTATNQQLIGDYSAITGFNPNIPSTDQGANEQDVLNYYTNHGFPTGDKLLGWLSVDASNPTLLKQAIYLFENVYYGIEIPNAYTNPMPQSDGFVWGKAGSPNPNQGHCIIACGYNADGTIVDTWGLLGTLTWDANAEYMVNAAGGDAYILISAAQLIKATQKAPNGLDAVALIQDFNFLGGNLPAPPPSPTPTPTPTPSPTPTPTPTPTPVPTPVGSQITQFDETNKIVLVPHGHSVINNGDYRPFLDPKLKRVNCPTGWRWRQS